MTRKIQRRLSHYFRGWKRIEDERYLDLEDMTEVRQEGRIFESSSMILTTTEQLPCPEYDLQGRSRFEALNAEINAPELAGIALLGDDIQPVPVFLEGEPRKYCLQFDGQWI